MRHRSSSSSSSSSFQFSPADLKALQAAVAAACAGRKRENGAPAECVLFVELVAGFAKRGIESSDAIKGLRAAGLLGYSRKGRCLLVSARPGVFSQNSGIDW